VSSILLVEGKSDKYFFEFLSKEYNLRFEIHEIGGIDNLKKALYENIDKYENIGIVLDMDNATIDERLSFVNNCLQEMEINMVLDKNFDIKEFDGVKIGCFFINPYLEEFIINISQIEKTAYRCIEHWINCFDPNKERLSDKEIKKLYYEVFKKYDICNKKERQNYQKNCNEKNLFEKMNINFSKINNIKNFLEELIKC